MSSYLTGIVLSAGLSGRMNDFKPLLKLKDGKTFIQSIVEKLSQVCDDVIVVTGYRSEDIIKHVQSNNVKFVLNRNFEQGMFTSLQASLRKTKSQWYLYHFVDQPSLPMTFYNEFVNQIEKDINWVQPVIGERKGHPILFDKTVKEIIIKSDKQNSLRDVMRDESINKKFWVCNYEMILQDIDTENEYNSLDK